MKEIEPNLALFSYHFNPYLRIFQFNPYSNHLFNFNTYSGILLIFAPIGL